LWLTGQKALLFHLREGGLANGEHVSAETYFA
jgi:hypothetical protein